MSKFFKTVSQFGASKFVIFQKHDDDGNLTSFLSFVPLKGGNIIDLMLAGEYILDGYSSSKDLEDRHTYKSEILAPFPNRLNKGKFTFEEQEYIFPSNEVDRGHALHGFLAKEPFELLEEDVSENLRLKLKYTYKKKYAYFPFEFDMILQYEIIDEKFKISFELINIGTESLPFGLGWHPYLLFEEDEKVSIDSCHLNGILMDENMIPIGSHKPTQFKSQKIEQLNLDNTYQFQNLNEPNLIILSRTLKSGKILSLTFANESMQTAFEYLQIYHPLHSTSIAIEPMSCNVDAFNNKEGLLVLESQQSKTFEFSIQAKLIHS